MVGMVILDFTSLGLLEEIRIGVFLLIIILIVLTWAIMVSEALRNSTALEAGLIAPPTEEKILVLRTVIIELVQVKRNLIMCVPHHIVPYQI